MTGDKYQFKKDGKQGTLKQVPSMEKPQDSAEYYSALDFSQEVKADEALEKYQQHLASLNPTVITIEDYPQEWKHDEIVEEGKDFYLQHQVLVKDLDWYDCKISFYNDLNPEDRRIVARPIAKEQAKQKTENMKDIRDSLHYYLGCEIICNGGHYKGEKAIIEGIDRTSGITTRHIVKGDFNIISWEFFDKYWKIILRPLSDMTEDEAADVYTIERDSILHTPTNDVGVRQRTDFGWVVTRLDHLNIGLLIKYDGVCYKVINEGRKPTIEPAMNQPLIFHYLLSNHFDIFNLIPDGLALDKTKLP